MLVHERGERLELNASAAFIFIGAKANTDRLTNTLALDKHGFILTGDAAAASNLLEASAAVAIESVHDRLAAAPTTVGF